MDDVRKLASLVKNGELAVGQKQGNPEMVCPGKWKHGRFNLRSDSWFKFDPPESPGFGFQWKIQTPLLDTEVLSQNLAFSGFSIIREPLG